MLIAKTQYSLKSTSHQGAQFVEATICIPCVSFRFFHLFLLYFVCSQDIDELYEKKRILVSEFKTAEKEWQHFRESQRRRQRDDFMRKKEEERRLQAEEYEKDL